MRLLALTLSMGLLGACAPAPMHAGPDPSPPRGAPTGPDGCGAASHQWLVGRSHSDVPPAPPSRNRRVYATGDMLTMDYSPQRLNIEYDPRTHRIVRVYCG